MDMLQLVQLWAGLGFSAVLVAFFIVAFFKRGKWEQGQWVVVRILASLCAAFAAALFTGSALVDYQQEIGTGGRFSFQGAAGFALFFVVWYFFPKFETPPPPPDGNVSLPPGMTFSEATRLIGEKNLDHARSVDLRGFVDSELNAPLLSAALINLKDGRAALLRIRDFTGAAVGPYDVRLESDRYQLERKS
jgi:hypothetical protein